MYGPEVGGDGNVAPLPDQGRRSLMRNERITTVLVWAACSAICASGIVYLGANTERSQGQWLLAGSTGAIVGASGALIVLWLCGNRRGILFLGLPFAVLQAMIFAAVLSRLLPICGGRQRGAS